MTTALIITIVTLWGRDPRECAEEILRWIALECAPRHGILLSFSMWAGVAPPLSGDLSSARIHYVSIM